MNKPELEKKIFLHLTNVNFSTLDEMKNLFNCEEDELTKIIAKNSKSNLDPLGFILVDKQSSPYRYSICLLYTSPSPRD